MSKVSSLVLGVVAGAAMFGAIQYASGNDLRGTLTDMDQMASNTAASSKADFDTVNRSSKGDRAALNIAQNDRQSQTLSFRVQGMSDTSVLVRLASTPAVPAAAKLTKSPAVTMNVKPQRAAVACEPPVSVLTEIAKVIQYGRCVT